MHVRPPRAAPRSASARSGPRVAGPPAAPGRPAPPLRRAPPPPAGAERRAQRQHQAYRQHRRAEVAGQQRTHRADDDQPIADAGRQPGLTAVSEVMTANPRAVGLDETIEECLFIMHEFGFRHLPIVEGKELKGLVSLRDIVLRQAAELDRQARRAAS